VDYPRCHLKKIEVLGVTNDFFSADNHYITIHVRAIDWSGEPKIMEPEKTEEIKWVDISEIDSNDLTQPSRFDLEIYKQKYKLNSRSAIYTSTFAGYFN
jgi:hypothetical protein